MTPDSPLYLRPPLGYKSGMHTLRAKYEFVCHRLRLFVWTGITISLAACVLLSGCVAFDHSETRTPTPLYALTKKTTTRSLALDRDADRTQAIADALDAEQAYIDMLAEYATGRLAPGQRMTAGLYALPAGSMSGAVEPFLGIPYKWGGATPQGLDCSGFTMLVYKRFGLNLPHSSVAQAQMGVPIGRGELQAGDLVFFAVNNGQSIDHVGIMVSRDLMAHCSGLRGRVAVEPLARVYPTSFVVARRLTTLRTALD